MSAGPVHKYTRTPERDALVKAAMNETGSDTFAGLIDRLLEEHSAYRTLKRKCKEKKPAKKKAKS